MHNRVDPVSITKYILRATSLQLDATVEVGSAGDLSVGSSVGTGRRRCEA